MTTQDCMAQLARRALAEGRDANLLVAGVGRLSCAGAPALLYDDDGEPRFTCGPGSPIAAAVGRPALLRVAAPFAGNTRTTVMIAGRLARLAADPRNPPEIVTVGLPVEHVVVMDGHERQRIIPLDAYVNADPDPLLAHARSLLAHTNARHRPQLRAFAASRNGLRPDQVAEATLAALDADGARLDWIDVDGAHSMALPFSHSAADPQALSDLLRTHLCPLPPSG